MAPKVSVVIPVYNVEKYLKECIDSVLGQTLKDIEVICVNDGSTDGSGKILDEYAKNDSRVIVIHKKNSGYGHTMNVGMERATGEYIGIVESDDFIDSDMYEILYQEAIENSLDVVRSGFYLYNTKNNSNEILDQSWVKHDCIYAPFDEQATFMQQPSVWANLYNRNFLKDNGITFLTTPGASYQDVAFTFKVYATAKRFKMINKCFLHYRTDNESSSINSTGKVFCVCDEYAEIESYIKKYNKYEDYRYLITRMKYNCYKWNYNRLSRELKKMFLKKMSQEYRRHYMDGDFEKKRFSIQEYKKILTIAFLPFLHSKGKDL